jgi:hypothetical protein
VALVQGGGGSGQGWLHLHSCYLACGVSLLVSSALPWGSGWKPSLAVCPVDRRLWAPMSCSRAVLAIYLSFR